MFFILLILSCIKQSVKISFEDISEMKNNDVSLCISGLKKELQDRGCDQMAYTRTSEFDIMIRCVKPNSQRKDMWDTYVFRLAPPFVKGSESDEQFFQNHKICEDALWRVEAYKPSE